MITKVVQQQLSLTPKESNKTPEIINNKVVKDVKELSAYNKDALSHQDEDKVSRKAEKEISKDKQIIKESFDD